MEILRNKLWDEAKQKEAFLLFKKAADDEKDLEACWRVTACFFLRGMGTKKDSQKGLSYAKIAFDADLVEGIFWYAKCLPIGQERFQLFEQLSERNSVEEKFYVGYCLYCELGTAKNEVLGHQIIEGNLRNSNDRYWTFANANFVENGRYDFAKNEKQSEELYEKARTQNIANNSIFDPWGFSNSSLKRKWQNTLLFKSF
jgi:TPR repeat protein